MKLTMLGTGNALVTECYNTCFVLEENEKYFMVDGGGGSAILHQLKHAGFNWMDMREIFITHKHIDHLTGKTYVNEIRNGEIISYTITPEQFGLKSCELSELIGGTPKENAEITRRILTGEETGPKRDVILMNAGMSLYLGIDGITLAEGIEKAKEMIDSGKAYAKLQEFVKATQEA